MAENSNTKVMAERNIQSVTAGQRVTKVLVYFFLYLFLGFMALIVLFPFYWMLISSVKDLTEYNLAVPTLFPQQFDFANYLESVIG